ncbi:hypothetical protein M422DRAFT_164833, partial [Sphaerobolus stellatus SS14]
SIAPIASCINRAHKETKFITVVIENMAASGNVLGSRFEEIASIIEHVEDKSRVGVCIDTCKSGYDIRTKESYKYTSYFSSFVFILISFPLQVNSLKYFCGMHINGSKTALTSHRDRHDNMSDGTGNPIIALGYIISDTRRQNILMILETPIEDDPGVWQEDTEVHHDLYFILAAR